MISDTEKDLVEALRKITTYVQQRRQMPFKFFINADLESPFLEGLPECLLYPLVGPKAFGFAFGPGAKYPAVLLCVSKILADDFSEVDRFLTPEPVLNTRPIQLQDIVFEENIVGAKSDLKFIDAVIKIKTYLKYKYNTTAMFRINSMYASVADMTECVISSSTSPTQVGIAIHGRPVFRVDITKILSEDFSKIDRFMQGTNVGTVPAPYSMESVQQLARTEILADKIFMEMLVNMNKLGISSKSISDISDRDIAELMQRAKHIAKTAHRIED